MIIPTHDLSTNISHASVHQLMKGKLDTPGETPFPFYIDVRDAAHFHTRAYEEVVASNQRYAITSGIYSQQQIVDIMRKHFPSLKERLPAGRTEESEVARVDISKATRDLGFAPRGLEETIVETVGCFLEIEQIGHSTV